MPFVSDGSINWISLTFSSVQVVVAESDCRLDGVNTGLVDLALVAGLVPGGTCAIAQLETLSDMRH